MRAAYYMGVDDALQKELSKIPEKDHSLQNFMKRVVLLKVEPSIIKTRRVVVML